MSIYKSGLNSVCTNYKPISVISTFSKVTGKIVKFFLIYTFFSSNQFVFRIVSTETLLLSFISAINEGVNNSQCVSTLYYDIKKAFDTIVHEIFQQKKFNSGNCGVVSD